MTFIFYIIYIILISLISILWGLTVAGAIYLYFFTLVSLTLLLIALVYGIEATKYLLKKILLASMYLPIFIYFMFKVSIFLTDFFDKFPPPC